MLAESDSEFSTKRDRVAHALFRLGVEEGNVHALRELVRLDVFSDHEQRLERLEESSR